MNNRNDELVLTNSTTERDFSKIVEDNMCSSDGSQGRKADNSKTMILGAQQSTGSDSATQQAASLTGQSTAINTHAANSDYGDQHSTLDLSSLPPLEGFEFRDLLWQQVDVMELKVDHKGTEIKLMTYRWEPEQDQEVKGVIFMVHGYGANAAQMAVVAKYMAQNGYDVFAVDMRGHGDSEGERGVFLSSDQLYSDLWAFIFESIKKFRINQQTTPLLLMGRSFGGLLITNMANTLVGKSMFKGVVLITPYYRLFTERLYEAYKYLVPLTYVRPNHLFLSEYAEMDPEYYKRYEQVLKDPRNVDGFTATTARIWVEEQEVARKSISETPLPICFLIATEDGVVRNDYIEEFSGLASHSQNECHKVHGADHTDLIFNEHYCSQMIRTIDNFLDKLLTNSN